MLIYSCKETTRAVSDSLDRDLGRAERFRMRLHLLICGLCRNFSKQAHFLHRAARQHGSRDKRGS
ncbi:zf-HC2 domain-containing protein [Chitinimonas sp.]|uniref:zf-HC2 domain-containing protein n=1 Tax=Chitinimonas sp. TaxID=1934313 RepID=UPI0035B0731C